MWAYTPVADRLATKCAAKPPNLGMFLKLQQSRFNLAVGLLLAWVIGAFVEEVALRGLVLQWIEMLTSPWMAWPLPSALAVCGAAMAAGIADLYQGLRAAIIIFQLSIMFGALFVIDGHNLWSVIFCHGFYDTIAFIRFANRSSKYSMPDSER
jgi:membrane protease YdiL (CAAX protease family)